MALQNRLTDLKVRRARPDEAKAYRLADGAGLFLYVPPSGVKSWQFRYRFDGRPQTLTLGRVDSMSLGQAREEARSAREDVRKGKHLATERRVLRAQRAADASATFCVVADQWIVHASRTIGWSDRHRAQVKASIENHLGKLAQLPVSHITAAVAAPILDTLDRRAPEMRAKVEPRLHAIMHFAVRRGLLVANPLPPAERRKRAAKHFPAITESVALGELLGAVDKAEAARGVKRAHVLCAFTALRISEIVAAEWVEVDLEAGVWSVPRERMKVRDAARGPHVVPLPRRLRAQLAEWKRSDSAGARYVCPAPRGDGHVTPEAVEKLYRRLGYSGRHSPHSWRSAFKSLCADAGKSADVVEAQLDHVVGNKVASAYDRAKRLDLRRALLNWYEAKLLATRDGAEVVQLASVQR